MTGLSNTGSTQLPPITLDPVGQEGLVSKNVVNPEVANGLQNIVQQTAKQEVANQASKKTILSGLGQKKQQEAAQNIAVDIEAGDKEPGFFDGLMSGLGNIAGQAGDFLGTDQGRLLLSGVAGHAVGREFGVPGVAGGIQGIQGGMQQIGLERKQKQANNVLAQKSLSENTLSNKDKTELTLKLGDKAISDNKNYAVIRDNMTNIEAVTQRLLDNPEGSRIAIDQATIISFNKILDPTSVVRESEYERTPGDAAWFNRAKASVNRISKGGKLDKADILEIRDVSRAMEKIRRRTANSKIEKRRAFATKRGLEPDEVAIKFGDILAGNKGAKKVSKVSVTAQNSQNDQALEWAQANPNDPRAKQILQKLGV